MSEQDDCICDEYDYEMTTKIDPKCPEHGYHDASTARSCLRENLLNLRYSGSVATLLPTFDGQPEVEFLDDISRWLIEFAGVLETVSATNTDMARELTELRSQRTAIRKFLGLTTNGDL